MILVICIVAMPHLPSDKMKTVIMAGEVAAQTLVHVSDCSSCLCMCFLHRQEQAHIETLMVYDSSQLHGPAPHNVGGTSDCV